MDLGLRFSMGCLNITLADERKRHPIASVVTNWQPISIAGHQIKSPVENTLIAQCGLVQQDGLLQ